MIIDVTVPGFQCFRCEHKWVPRNTDNPPRVCPKCKSPYWDRPRKATKATNQVTPRFKTARRSSRAN